MSGAPPLFPPGGGGDGPRPGQRFGDRSRFAGPRGTRLLLLALLLVLAVLAITLVA